MIIVKSASDSKKISDIDYSEFCGFLEESCGIVLGDNKQYLVNSRLKRLLKDHNLDCLSDLVRILMRNSDARLKEHTIDAMTTNETSWFRDNYPYDVLKNKILPEMTKRGNTNIRIWSSACSSGQEPYSIAMILHEFNAKHPGFMSGHDIYATDISPTMLAEARSGVFDQMSIARGLSAEREKLFFSHSDGIWQVRDNIKSNITFRETNLMNSFSIFGKFDIIFCRNVLIYFSIPLKKDIINRMSDCLNPGGYLILGGTESVTNYSDKFDAISYENGIIYRIK